MGLSPQTFLATVEMIFSHLRLKDSDRWSKHICRLKYQSFVSEFPEVGNAQFMWAAERWIQGLDQGFHRYPTWRELMAHLYRCESGVPNRSWGPKPDLPPFVRFTQEQLAMMPNQASTVMALPGAEDAAAYASLPGARRPPPAALTPVSGPALSDEEWERYVLEAFSDASPK